MNPWVSLLIGLALLAPFTIQVSLFVRSQLRYRTWQHADARVVGMDTSRGDHSTGSESHAARYAYLDDSGRSRLGRAQVGRPLPLGSEMRIVYDPQNPKRSQPIDRLSAAHIGAGVMGFLVFLGGIFATVNGVLLLVTGHGIE